MHEKLKDYGLNQYEASAYCALLELGISTSSRITGKSGVPYGKIYPVLDSLEKKAFVKVIDGRPKKFVAVKPEVALFSAVKSREEEIEKLRSSTGNLIMALNSMGQKKEAPIEKVHIITGYKNYLNISAGLRDKASTSWRTISRIPVFKPHLDAYRESINKGLKVKVLTSITDNNRHNVRSWLNAGVELKETEYLPTRFSVIDETDIIFRITGDNKDESYVALWIENTSLASTMAAHFDNLWKKSKKIEF